MVNAYIVIYSSIQTPHPIHAKFWDSYIVKFQDLCENKSYL
jgi:hypothetical protein